MSTFYAAKARLRGKNVESLNDIRTRLHKDIFLMINERESIC